MACAGEAFLASAPLAYSSLIVDEPKPSYEYSTSVQTPSYNNYAHVRSGGNFERKIYNFGTPFAAAPVLAAEPIVAEAKFFQPVRIFWNISRRIITRFVSVSRNFAFQAIAQPLLKAAPLSTELRTVATAPAIAFPTTKLLPIAYESKPFYRFAAPAAAQILSVDNKFIGEGKSQYHSQNELGEASYGHREAFQSHDAVQDAQGNKAGSFSYVAPDGRLLTTEYIADQAGYRVASNALPNAPNAAAAPAAIQPIVAAVEKPAEFNDADGVVVEVNYFFERVNFSGFFLSFRIKNFFQAKSRSRRSVAALAPAPLAYSYSSPLAYSAYSYPAYSSYAYSAPAYSAPAYSSLYYNAPLYRSYAYASYPSYAAYPSYNYAFRK